MTFHGLSMFNCTFCSSPSQFWLLIQCVILIIVIISVFSFLLYFRFSGCISFKKKKEREREREVTRNKGQVSELQVNLLPNSPSPFKIQLVILSLIMGKENSLPSSFVS